MLLYKKKAIAEPLQSYRDGLSKYILPIFYKE